MSSQTEKSLGDDKTRGDSQPDRLEKEGDFSGESSSILGDASQEGVGDAQPPSKTEVSIGQVKSVSNPDRPIGESDPEEPRIGIFESLALPKRDFLEPTKRLVPSLEGKDEDGKGPKAKPAGASYSQSGQEESKFKLKDESKVAVAVAEQKEKKQSSGGIVKHRPAKIPHHVENKSQPSEAKQGLPDQSQVVKGTTGEGGHLGKASITDSGLGLGQYQDSSLGFGQDSTSKFVPDLGQHLSSLLQRVRAGVNVSNKTKWRRLSSSSAPGGESSNKSKSVLTDVKGKDEDRGHTVGDNIPPKSSSMDIPKPQGSLIQKEDPGFKGAGVVAVPFGESATDVRKDKSSDRWEHSGDEKNQSQKSKMSFFERKERENDKRRESGSVHETDGQGTGSLKLQMATVQGGSYDTKSMETGESSTLGRKLDEPRRLETGEKRKLSYPEILDSLKRKRFDFSGIKKKLASRQHLRTSQEALTQDQRKKVKVEDNRAPAIESKLGLPSISVSRPERDPLLDLPTTSVSRPREIFARVAYHISIQARERSFARVAYNISIQARERSFDWGKVRRRHRKFTIS
ncbi:hypothetical protein BSL78_07786 [Apostichopus japonicus]|uniref:Uncharacterized protein n=1 Tax=Stichopus japonicus TaxID=307972 RepID=A0A2G8L4Y3_STIJA|nr:hypothetical protein BSL78_07786 [Apostichopus japonicus]